MPGIGNAKAEKIFLHSSWVYEGNFIYVIYIIIYIYVFKITVYSLCYQKR